MTPAELYVMTPESVDHDLFSLAGCYYNHLPEAGEDSSEWICCKSDRVEVRHIKYFSYDGRRFWRLSTVWFENEPVMVIQNAGREGDDFHRRIVTSQTGLLLMANYILSLIPPDNTESIEVFDPNQEVEGLTEFYNQSLSGPFERYHYYDALTKRPI